MRGVDFSKGLFGKSKSSVQKGVGMSESMRELKLVKHNVPTFADSSSSVAESGRPLSMLGPVPRPIPRPKSEFKRTFRSRMRFKPHQLWSLCLKIVPRRKQQNFVRPESRVSMLSIGRPQEFRHVTHVGGRQQMLSPSSLNTSELFETFYETSDQEYGALTERISFVQAAINPSVSSTLYEVGLAPSVLVKREPGPSPHKRRPSTAPSGTRSPSRVGFLLDQERRPSSSLSKRKPVPYHILDETVLVKIPSADSTSPHKFSS